MSTSLLVNKMREAAKMQGKEYEIDAHGLTSVDKLGAEADCILLGPQVRYAEKSIREKFPDKPVCFIDMRIYGTMNGKGTLELAEKAMAEKGII